jgi:iron complex outermembrane receptor protein
VAAQSTGAISGRITDAETNRPLPGVNVVLAHAQTGTVTDSTGHFALADVPTGRDTLVARFVGYQTARRTVRVPAGQSIRVSIRLQRKVTQMRGITVTSMRPSIEPTGSLESSDIRTTEVADPGALLRDVPGVGAVRRGAMGLDPNVRGLAETQVGVYIGGMRTFPAGPARMDSPMSHVDPSTIESIEVVKGPYALTWGPGNMSAVRVTQRGEDPPNTPLTGSVQTGYDANQQSTETTAFAMGRQGNWFYSSNLAWRRGTDYTAGNGESIPGDYTSAEGRGRIGIELSDQSTLSITGSYQNQTDLDYPGRLLNAEFFETGMGRLQYEWTAADGRLRSLTVRASAQQTLHEMTNRGKPTFEAGTLPNGMARPPLRIGVQSEIQNYSGRVAADLALGRWTLTVGGDVLHTFRDASRPLFAVQSGGSRVVPGFYTTGDGERLDNLWPGVTITQGGLFLEATRSLGTVTLTGTVRLDLARSDANTPTGPFLDNAVPGPASLPTSALSQTDVMPSGAVMASIPVTEQWSLSLGLGSVARAPSALERYSDRFPASKSQTSAEFQGDPSIAPERSTQADVWVDGAGERWSVQVNGFARHVDDYVTPEATTLSPILPLSPDTVFRYTNGEAEFVGGEISGTVALLPTVTVRASGSVLWGRNTTLDEPAFGVAPPSADLGLRWSPGIDRAWASRPFVDGSVHLAAEQSRTASTRGETATEGYTTVDLKTGARLWEQVEVELGVENLFDVTYTNHLNAKNPFTGTPLPEPGRVFTANVTVHF